MLSNSSGAFLDSPKNTKRFNNIADKSLENFNFAFSRTLNKSKKFAGEAKSALDDY